MCSTCSRYKRCTASSMISAQDTNRGKISPKPVNNDREPAEDETAALNRMMAVARRHPQIGCITSKTNDPSGLVYKAFEANLSKALADVKKERQASSNNFINAVVDYDAKERSQQLTSLLHDPSKEPSPPYTPQSVPGDTVNQRSMSDAYTQVNLDGPAEAQTKAKLQINGVDENSCGGIPLGPGDSDDDYIPGFKFPCSICSRRVISDVKVTTCTPCLNKLESRNRASRPRRHAHKAPSSSSHIVVMDVWYEMDHSKMARKVKDEVNDDAIELMSYGSDDGEKYPQAFFLDEVHEGLQYGGSQNEDELDDYEECYEDDYEDDHPDPLVEKISHWQRDIEARDEKGGSVYTAQAAYSMLIDGKFDFASRKISRQDYNAIVDDARQSIDESLLITLLELHTTGKVIDQQKNEPDDFSPLSCHSSGGRAIPEELLHRRLQDSNQDLEDLKIKIRHMKNEMDASKKSFKQTLQEKDDKIAQLNKTLEDTRRTGQRAIQKLQIHIKELKHRPEVLNPEGLYVRGVVERSQSFQQLQGEYHAIRKERSKWLTEKSSLENSIQNLETTTSGLKIEKEAHKAQGRRLKEANETLKQEIADLKVQLTQTKDEDQPDEEYAELSANNHKPKRTLADLKDHVLRQGRELASTSRKSNPTANSSSLPELMAENNTPVPDITGYKPVAHQDLLTGYPIGAIPFDPDAKRAEIEARPRRKYEGRVSTLSRKRRAEDYYMEPLRWRKKRRSKQHTKQLLAVDIPRDSLSFEERSSYSKHSDADQGQTRASDTIRVVPPSNVYEQREIQHDSRMLNGSSGSSEVRTNTDDSYNEEPNGSSSPYPTTSSSSSGRRTVHDPVDLSTRGALLKSSLGRAKSAAPAKPHIINEDPDASPPPFTSRNEASMAKLKKALGVPEELKPSVRKGKLYMEEVRRGEENEERRRRVQAWPVGG